MASALTMHHADPTQDVMSFAWQMAVCSLTERCGLNSMVSPAPRVGACVVGACVVVAGVCRPCQKWFSWSVGPRIGCPRRLGFPVCDPSC